MKQPALARIAQSQAERKLRSAIKPIGQTTGTFLSRGAATGRSVAPAAGCNAMEYSHPLWNANVANANWKVSLKPWREMVYPIIQIVRLLMASLGLIMAAPAFAKNESNWTLSWEVLFYNNEDTISEIEVRVLNQGASFAYQRASAFSEANGFFIKIATVDKQAAVFTAGRQAPLFGNAAVVPIKSGEAIAFVAKVPRLPPNSRFLLDCEWTGTLEDPTISLGDLDLMTDADGLIENIESSSRSKLVDVMVRDKESQAAGAYGHNPVDIFSSSFLNSDHPAADWLFAGNSAERVDSIPGQITSRKRANLFDSSPRRVETGNEANHEREYGKHQLTDALWWLVGFLGGGALFAYLRFNGRRKRRSIR